MGGGGGEFTSSHDHDTLWRNNYQIIILELILHIIKTINTFVHEHKHTEINTYSINKLYRLN